MKEVIIRKWPFISMLVLFLAAMAQLVTLSIKHGDGSLVYPIDDTYIHMSIAQNTAVHQVWGVTKYSFSSTTSSPLWTFLLAISYGIFGVNNWAPLLLNVFIGSILIIVAGLFLEKFTGSGHEPVHDRSHFQNDSAHPYWISRSLHFIAGRHIFSAMVLFAAIFATPLPSLAMIGIEHVLHTLLTLCFIGYSVTVLDATPLNVSIFRRHRILFFNRFGSGKQSEFESSGSMNGQKETPNAYLYLILLAPLLTMSRYEGLFLALVVCVLMLPKNVVGAVLIGSAALLPVTAYGLWSVLKGWYFLPNSLLLKGQIPDQHLPDIILMLHRTLAEMQLNPHMLLLVVISLLLVLLHRSYTSDDRLWYAHVIYSGTVFLHMTFASTGWLYRYEAYLVFVGIVIIGASAGQICRGLLNRPLKNAISREGFLAYYFQMVVVLLLAAVVAYPFVNRAFYSYMITPVASGNIYEQQIQMGRFLRTYYQGDAVAANDIGAITWLADFRLLDLVGLGSLEPVTLKRENRFSTSEIDRLAREGNVAVAIVYDDWFDGVTMPSLPPEWERAGQWRIFNNVIAGSDVVSFYAVDPSKKDELIHNLEQFSKKLPAGVEQSGLLPEQ